MNYSKIAQRYSKAIFDLAIEQNLLEEIKEDMMLFSRVNKENNEYRKILKCPVVKQYKKAQIIDAIFSKKVQELSLAFFKILLKKNREVFIEHIANAFIEMYREYKKIKCVFFETTCPLTDKIRQEVIDIMQKETSYKIEFFEEHNPDLLGGFKLKYDDFQYDASIQRKIKELRKEFSKNIYVKEF